MAEELLGRGDPVIRRLQQAFANEEPATDLAAVMQRVAHYQAGEPQAAHAPPPPGHGVTPSDLVGARRRQARPRIEPLDQLTHPALSRLSPREREILSLLAKGWSNRRIAEECFLSLNTVRAHVQNVLVKLGVHSKLEAVSLALEQGWASASEDPEVLDPDRLANRENHQA